jgi:hypothetical protein
MPFIVDPQPDEEVYLLREFRGSHGHVFAIAISNQAIYLPAQKFALKKDPWYFKRVPLSEVKAVRFVKQKSGFLLILSALMIVFGGATGFLLMWYALRGEAVRVSGWPLAFFVGGIIIPFIARGRRTLVVIMSNGKYKWKPQLAVDKRTRETYVKIQDEILQACRKAGIQTSE